MHAYFRPVDQPYAWCPICDGKGCVYVIRNNVVMRDRCACENGMIPISSADTTNRASSTKGKRKVR